MPKHVLDVGNCGPDHSAIRNLVEQNFDARVQQAHDLAGALAALDNRRPDLVLVNRKLDIDYSDGMAILRHMKSEPRWADIPVMLITNYPEYQAEAIAAGAVSGFGKQELRSSETLSKLAQYLE